MGSQYEFSRIPNTGDLNPPKLGIPRDPNNPLRDCAAAAAAESTGALAVTNAPLPCKYPKGDIALIS